MLREGHKRGEGEGEDQAGSLCSESNIELVSRGQRALGARNAGLQRV